MVNALGRAYTLFRLLSLDIVLGAVLGAKVIALLYRVDVPDSTYLLLAIAVWLIYILDHLIDAQRMKSRIGRHDFYFRFRLPLVFSVILMAGFAVVLLALQPTSIIMYGFIALVMVAAYLLLINHRNIFRHYLKEFSCALIYAIGICLPAFALGAELPATFFLVFAFYLISAWINLLTISVVEKEYDSKAGFGSLVQYIGEERTLLAINFLFITVAILISIFLWFQDYSPVWLLFIVMTGIQLMLVLNRSRLLDNEKYRILGDLVYVLPVILLIIS